MKLGIIPVEDHPEVKLFEIGRIGDERGFFSETYNERDFRREGLDVRFVQDNHSLSRQRGTLRGLHFQTPPHAQGKLVRVTCGAILDVAVDIRHGSPTFGRHVAFEISAENWRQLYVPAGYAHGFVTLTDDTEVQYKVTDFYSAEHDAGLRWDDPALGIDWRVDAGDVVLSGKDTQHPLLAELPPYFEYTQSD
ncbi:dTDP-4-dehydrorhamnose 3,5-epimerase [Parvibaculum indicum]|uniref:dTDP-4-dehydrorhamnose 3,5-epimerase n=1 Tax=Parvibaculum indicum TaxID=562969 RepID=UPI001420EE15|nr:dTDP-4-dehydrorhamnose 3,5-epimerase [Parvibaculum indicum]NIJ41444.1 dTDP-4-dehydrorhamnose 3,5-epimerase [Parvibaculum indicum]